MKLMLQPPAVFEFSPVKVAIVTGLSNGSAELSVDQRNWMNSVNVPETWKVPLNFPFVASEHSGVSGNSLLRASWNNTLQFTSSHFFGYRRLAAPHWQAIASSTERLLLITGSCGLQIANTIPASVFEQVQIEILALGPVSFRLPDCSTVTVRGDCDPISRLFFRRVDILLPSLRHLDYWYNDATKEIAANWLSDKISELLEPAATCPTAPLAPNRSTNDWGNPTAGQESKSELKTDTSA